MALEKQLLKQWDEALFNEKYVPAVAKEERLYDQHATFSEWLSHLFDALELVDWRSGEIRDRVSNEWLLAETLTGMATIDHPRVQQWVKTLRRHQALINGHTPFRSQAQEAEHLLQTIIANDSQRQQMADELLSLLDAACRTSSLMEGVNDLLKQFLHNHQAFRSLETLQLYLNFFVLWHNMRLFERGKRQGKSPYQHAGIDPGTDDWLTLLGYPSE